MPRPADAIVLTSGGLDSTTVLAIAQSEGHLPLPLTFRYGQTHDVEVDRAREIVVALGITEHLVLSLPLREIGGSALLGEGEIPTDSGAAGTGGIPATYVPARNTVFLALALSVAEARSIRDIYLGVNALDYSGYPDCRPEFVAAFEHLANLATREGIEHEAPWFRIHAPLVALRKSEIIRRGAELGVDYALTISCYAADAAGRACGRCESCGLRRRGFEEAGLEDPTPYV